MAGTSDKPDGTPAGPDDINSRLAEIAAELASEARFKEPSAAERARARVTAVGPAAKQVRRRFGRRRAQRKAEELRRTVDSPDVLAPPTRLRQSRRARRAASRLAPDRGYADATMPSVLRSVIAVAIILALLVGVSIGLRYLFRHFGPAATGGAPRNTPTAVLSAGPSASATTAANPLHPFNPADPFAGTKAASFAAGEAGIKQPRATTVGNFSVAQVRVAYATTRKLLIDGYLKPQVLYGGTPTAFANLLDTTERAQFLRDLTKTGRSPTGQQLSTRSWVNTFVPGTVPVGTIIKVHGTMTPTTAKVAGRTVLRIRADYLFVYPVQRFGDPGSGIRVVNRVVMTVDFAAFDEPASSAFVAHVHSIAGGPTGVQCGTYDGYVHPAFAGGSSPSAQPTGTPIDPYDQSTPPTTASCAPTTGT